MKLGRTRLDNTDEHLLAMLRIASCVTAEALARYTYPQSKQLHKKRVTYMKRLRRLQRLGYVREVQGKWVIR